MLDSPSGAARRQRIVVPLFILIVGIGGSMWLSRGHTDRMREIERTVAGICETAVLKGDVTALVADAGPVADAVNDAIVVVCREWKQDESMLQIEVRMGDVMHFEGASHVAIIRLADVERLGLRVMYDDRPRIIGFWWPGGEGGGG